MLDNLRMQIRMQFVLSELQREHTFHDLLRWRPVVIGEKY